MANTNIWYNYKGALLLKRPPHAENLDITKEDVICLLKSQKAHFARWTTDFDCGFSTEWWYCIRDEPIDISKLTSKQRYRINKGLKNVDVKKLTSESLLEHIELMADITIDCFKEYPIKYRPKVNREEFKRMHLEGIKRDDYWAVFDIESGNICGYAICSKESEMIRLKIVKIHPNIMKKEANAALAYQLCMHYLNEQGLKYICDGERSIRHETNYQEFLCRVLGFRFAYCKLNVVYSKLLGFCIPFLRPFYGIVQYLGNYFNFFYNIYCILRQDRIAQTFK